MNNVEFGHMAEAAVQKIYCEKGYHILASNLHYGRIGELDIVAHTRGAGKESLVFCEVKCRRDFSFADPLAAINRQKQNRMRVLAQIFLQRHPVFGQCDVRFDVAIVAAEDQCFFVDIIENAF